MSQRWSQSPQTPPAVSGPQGQTAAARERYSVIVGFPVKPQPLFNLNLS